MIVAAKFPQIIVFVPMISESPRAFKIYDIPADN